MQFDKLLVEGGEASLADPANYFLHMPDMKVIPFGYHSEKRWSFKIDSTTTTATASPTMAPPTVISSLAPTTTTSTTTCVTNIANAWLQSDFCARTHKSGLARPREIAHR
jgi:hypothetical protein